MTPSESSMSSTLPLMIGEEAEQPLHQGRVGVGPGHQLAGRHAVEVVEVQRLQVVVHGVAQVVLHVEGDPAAPVAADVGEAERWPPARPTRRTSHGHSGERVVDDDLVDDLALDEGDDGLAGAAEHRGAEGEDHVAAVAQHVAPEAADPARLAGVWVVATGAPDSTGRPRAWPGPALGHRTSSMAAPSQTSDSINRSPVGGPAAQVVDPADHLGLDPLEQGLALRGQAQGGHPLVAVDGRRGPAGRAGRATRPRR